LAVYIVVMWFFLTFADDQFKTDLTIIMVAILISSALGLVLLYASMPLIKQTETLYSELFFNCQFGSRSQPLAEYAASLQQLRTTPACASKKSVEDCDGFKAHQTYTSYLKNLEETEMCAGFCLPPLVDPSDVDATVSAISLRVKTVPKRRKMSVASGKLEIDSKGRGMSEGHADFLHTGQKAWVARTTASLSQAQRPGEIGKPTPALFSQVSSEISCDGAAARSIEYGGKNVGDMLYNEALTLLIVSILGSLLRVAVHIKDGSRRDGDMGEEGGGGSGLNRPRFYEAFYDAIYSYPVPSKELQAQQQVYQTIAL
jgi:hypothetical protein